MHILNSAVKKINYDAILYSYYLQSKSTREIEYEMAHTRIDICRYHKDLVQNQKLVCIHDLKSSNFRVKSLEKKLRRNRQFMREMNDIQDHYCESDDDQHIMNKFENSIAFRLFWNINMNLKQNITQ